MITVSARARSILAGSFEYHISVQSWLGDQLLAEQVPVAAGQEETDRGLRVPERVTLTVPKVTGAINWTPTTDTSPLAANGQTLKISLGVGKGPDGIEWFQRGEFLIQETEENDDGLTLAVTAVGLLALIDEAKFVAPFQISSTLVATARALIEPALTMDLTDAPPDRALPTSPVTFDTDRLAGFYALIDTWPAQVRMHEGGYLVVTQAVTPTVADVVRSFTTEPGGTVISASGKSSRDGAFSAILATGYALDGTEVRAVRYVATGPWAYPTGAANPLPVPYTFTSPVISSQLIAGIMAYVIMGRESRRAALRQYTLTCVPDPTLQVGDVVLVTTSTVTNLLCTVETIALPYFATGPMKIKVVSVA